MKPTDIRNENWEAIQTRITGKRREVYEAFLKGPAATTEQMAARSGINLLTLRPRVTELFDLKLLRLVEKRAGSGVYIGVPEEEARREYERERFETLRAMEKATNLQPELFQ